MACPDCFRGGKAVGDPQGTMTDMYGFKTYVAATPSTSTSPSTIIFYTDAFGLELVNNKLLADAYAIATGFRVLVPDVIPGGAMSLIMLDYMDTVMAPVAWTDLWGQLVRLTTIAKIIPHVVPFLWNALPSHDVCLQPCLAFARKVKADMPPEGKLGAAGFCWGGNQSIRVCSYAAVEGEGEGSPRLIDAQFCAHPSKLDLPIDVVNAVTKFKTPVAIAHAADDYALPMQQMEQTEAALREAAGSGDGENGFHYEIRIYKGVGHGFAVRAKPGSNVEADGADEAKQQAVEWFKKWL